MNVQQGQEIYLSFVVSDWLWGQLNLIFSGYRGHFHGAKSVWYEADCSPPSSAEVENECSSTCTVSYAFVVAKCHLYVPSAYVIFLDTASWLSGNTFDL